MQVQLQVSGAGKVSTTRAENTVSGPALLAVMVYVTLPPGYAVVTPSELVIDRSTSCAVRISQPKSAGGAPPKFASVPAGLFDANEPAAVVTKYWSVLVPRSGGEKMPWARLSSCAAVAPVVPLASSNATPAQIVELGRTNLVLVLMVPTRPAVKTIGLYVGAATSVPGPPPGPSGR
jgi:hypothetical protein